MRVHHQGCGSFVMQRTLPTSISKPKTSAATRIRGQGNNPFVINCMVQHCMHARSSIAGPRPTRLLMSFYDLPVHTTNTFEFQLLKPKLPTSWT
jgi:hypothetical protein